MSRHGIKSSQTKHLITARNEVGARLYFDRRVWFCSRGGGSASVHAGIPPPPLPGPAPPRPGPPGSSPPPQEFPCWNAILYSTICLSKLFNHPAMYFLFMRLSITGNKKANNDFNNVLKTNLCQLNLIWDDGDHLLSFSFISSCRVTSLLFTRLLYKATANKIFMWHHWHYISPLK